MEVKCRSPAGKDVTYVKGSLEHVLDHCSAFVGPSGKPVGLSDGERRRVVELARGMATGGLRVLALAHGEVPSAMVLDGLVGMNDPPRHGVAQSIASIQRSRGRVCMI